MGIFQSSQKEGKGIEKNALRPVRPLYFLELFGRKFGKLVLLNLLYICLTVPIWIALSLFVFNEAMLNDFSLKFVGDFLYLLGIIFVLFSPVIGPATAGMTYILKSFATETPVFMFSDFFEQFRKNFKQATLLSLINGIITISFSYTLIHPDSKLLLGSGGMLLGSMQLPLLIVVIIMIFINYYAYSIMVMFHLKFWDIIKNSFIFALVKLPLNLFLLALISIVSYYAFLYPTVGIALTALILYAFCGFLVVFSVYPTIENHMLIPANKQMQENNSDIPKKS